MADCDQVLARAEKQRSIHNCRAGHASLAELVGGHDGESCACGHYIDISNFAREIQMAAIRHWRSRKSFPALAKAFAVMDGAGFGIETSQHTEINAAVHIFAYRNRRLHIIAFLVVRPENR